MFYFIYYQSVQHSIFEFDFFKLAVVEDIQLLAVLANLVKQGQQKTKFLRNLFKDILLNLVVYPYSCNI